MIQPALIVGLAGIADAPILILLLPLAIFPFHIASAFGIGPGIMGHSTLATLIQVALICAFLSVPVLMPKWKKSGLAMKTLYFLIGYPAIMLSTNFIPYWMTRS